MNWLDRLLAKPSFLVKFAIAPAFAVLLLTGQAYVAVDGLDHASADIGYLVNRNMEGSAILADARATTYKIDADIYHLLTDQGAQPMDAATRSDRVNAIEHEMEDLTAQLIRYRDDFAQGSQKESLRVALRRLENLRGGFEVVSSMLSIDFISAASFVAPFDAIFGQVASTMDAIEKDVMLDSHNRANEVHNNARQLRMIFLYTSVGAAFVVAVTASVVARNSTKAIRDIADTTLALAREHRSVDVDSLRRGDELGGIVDSLETFARLIAERKQAHEQVRQLNRDLENRVADLHQSEQQLRNTLRELEMTQRQVIQAEKLAALGTLAAGVAHELANPMMGVMNYVAHARKLAREQRACEVLDSAQAELARMAKTLRGMLAFARPIDEPVTGVAIDAVLKRTFDLMQPEFATRGIDVTFDVEKGVPPVLAKEGHLMQVFVNLLANARDAVEMTAEKKIRLHAYRSDSKLVVDVTDTGIGIPADIQERIFDPFMSTKPPGKGTGLGLSISRNIMADLGGTITVHSQDGVGTTFTVWMPIKSVG